MFRALAVLCVVVTPALGLLAGGLQTTWGIPLMGSAYFALPQTLQQALDAGYVEMPRAKNETGYEECYCMCPLGDLYRCIFIDATNRTAGAQIALDIDTISNTTLDFSKRGYTLWNVTVNGTAKSFWTTQQYYFSNTTMQLSVAERLARHDNSTFLQDKAVYVTGFNGDLYSIPTNATNMADTNFTKQACIPLMGRHWFYNMTNNTECSSETLFPYFVLTYLDQLVGLGPVLTGVISVPEGNTQYFETPGEFAVRIIVPNGPACLYALGTSPGLITVHFYFVKYPLLVTCIGD